MSENNIKAMRLLLQTLLPKATQHAIKSYEEFSLQTAPIDAKKFHDHHKACKSALAHLDYLTKLAKWVETQATSQTDDDDSLEPMIVEARNLLLDYDSVKGNSDDE